MKRRINLSSEELSKIKGGASLPPPTRNGGNVRGGGDVPPGPNGGPGDKLCVECGKPIKECGCMEAFIPGNND